MTDIEMQARLDQIAQDQQQLIEWARTKGFSPKHKTITPKTVRGVIRDLEENRKQYKKFTGPEKMLDANREFYLRLVRDREAQIAILETILEMGEKA